MLKLFALLAPYRHQIVIVLVLALAQSIGSLLLPRLMSDIVDKGIVTSDRGAILRIGGLMLLISIAATACAIGGSYYSSKVASGFGRILRGAIFRRVEHFSIHQFDRFSSASLVTRTTNDTTQVQQMLILMLTMVITAPMLAVGGVILALSQDTQLAWVLVAVMPVMALVFGLILRGALPLSQAMQVKIDRLNQVLGEGLSGVRVIRAFDRGDHQRERSQPVCWADAGGGRVGCRVVSRQSLVVSHRSSSYGYCELSARRSAGARLEIAARSSSSVAGERGFVK